MGWASLFRSRSIELPPQRHPAGAEYGRSQESPSITVVSRQKDNQRRSHNRTDHAPAVKYTDGKSALGTRKPLVDGFYSAGKVAALAGSHPIAQQPKL